MTILDGLSFPLYSARKSPPLDRQLATLAEIGFRKVEPYGGLFDDLPGLVAALKRHGLSAPSTHVSLDRVKADPAGFAETARGIGVELAIIPAIPPAEREKDAEGWRAFGRELGALDAELRPHGMRLAWHNHDFELKKLPDGSYPLDHLLDAAPGLAWQMDIGWVFRAGESPLAWLQKHRERIAAVHLKDVAPPGEKLDEDGWADIGAGVIDWAALRPAIAATGARLFVLEHDNPTDWEGFARRSYAAVAGW